MPYIFKYTIKSGETQKITFLNREEFSALNDEEKTEYQAGPIIEKKEEFLSTLVVQGFIYDLVNQVDLFYIPKALDEFIKVNYKSKYEEACLSEPNLLNREELFWNFIDEVGDEALDGIDLHILNSIYKNDDLYSMLIEECKKRTKD